jgi:outer membrane receptor protein involved in Fe transport
MDAELPGIDVSAHKWNLGLSVPLWRRLDGDIRLNYVGARPLARRYFFDKERFSEALAQEFDLGSFQNGTLTQIDSVFVANAAIRYRDIVPGFSLQLVVNNLFDREYFSPGVDVADGYLFAERIPQPGRSIFACLIMDL